jgi:hypothetical protein
MWWWHDNIPLTTVGIVSRSFYIASLRMQVIRKDCVDAWGTYLSIISFGNGEEGIQRVVRGQNKPSNVDKELASDIEEDEEEVRASKAEECVYFGNGGLLLEVVEDLVL